MVWVSCPTDSVRVSAKDDLSMLKNRVGESATLFITRLGTKSKPMQEILNWNVPS